MKRTKRTEDAGQGFVNFYWINASSAKAHGTEDVPCSCPNKDDDVSFTHKEIIIRIYSHFKLVDQKVRLVREALPPEAPEGREAQNLRPIGSMLTPSFQFSLIVDLPGRVGIQIASDICRHN